MSYYLAGIVLFAGALVFAADTGVAMVKGTRNEAMYSLALTAVLALCALALFSVGALA
tara:strand:- start:21996 stop:22169 length:174 start_codon:yes stop_codon:yes gene_type:complete